MDLDLDLDCQRSFSFGAVAAARTYHSARNICTSETLALQPFLIRAYLTRYARSYGLLLRSAAAVTACDRSRDRPARWPARRRARSVPDVRGAGQASHTTERASGPPQGDGGPSWQVCLDASHPGLEATPRPWCKPLISFGFLREPKMVAQNGGATAQGFWR